MIDFSQKTYGNLLAGQLARVPNTLDKREGSLIQTALGPGAYALEEAYMDLDKLQSGGFALTAVGQDLDYKVAEAGITRYPATPAVRLGVFNTEIPLGSRFSTNNGAASLIFRATERISSGQYQLTCATAGTVGNEYSGGLLSIDFVDGLTSAELTDILVPGGDVEGDEALRARYKEYLNNKPFSGNVAAYRTEISAISGVGGVQVYPTWRGGGTVKCSIVGADYRAASDMLVDTVQTLIDPVQNSGKGYGLAAIGAQVTIGTPEEVTVDVDAQVDLASGYVVEQLAGEIEQAIEAYMRKVRMAWPSPAVPGTTEYVSWVFRSQIMAAMLAIPGVLNITGLTLNGEDLDIQLVETGELQQIPILGSVTLHGN